MNTNESELENALRALRPVAPSAALESRIAGGLAPRRASVSSDHSLTSAPDGDWPLGTVALRGWFHRLGWALAGAAAGVAVMLAIQRPPHSSPAGIAATAPAPSDPLAADTESEFIGADESPIFYSEASEPFRQMRFHSVERAAWNDPDSGARIAVEIPREDIVTMPVAMQ